MKTMEEIFKKSPFIYYIGGRYYAFGTGVCARCNSEICSLESRYKCYVDNCNKDLTQQQAFEIWRRVVSAAEYVEQKQGTCFKPEEEIAQFGFSNEEIKELEKQIEAYINFFKKHNLQNCIQ